MKLTWVKQSYLRLGKGSFVAPGEVVPEGALPEESVKAFIAHGHIVVEEEPKPKPKRKRRAKKESVEVLEGQSGEGLGGDGEAQGDSGE